MTPTTAGCAAPVPAAAPRAGGGRPRTARTRRPRPAPCPWPGPARSRLPWPAWCLIRWSSERCARRRRAARSSRWTSAGSAPCGSGSTGCGCRSGRGPLPRARLSSGHLGYVARTARREAPSRDPGSSIGPRTVMMAGQSYGRFANLLLGPGSSLARLARPGHAPWKSSHAREPFTTTCRARR